TRQAGPSAAAGAALVDPAARAPRGDPPTHRALAADDAGAASRGPGQRAQVPRDVAGATHARAPQFRAFPAVAAGAARAAETRMAPAVARAAPAADPAARPRPR